MFTIFFHSLTLSLQLCFIFVVSEGKDPETLTLIASIMLLLKIDTSYQANALDVVDVFENHSHSVSSDDGRVTLFYRRRHPLSPKRAVVDVPGMRQTVHSFKTIVKL